MPTIGSDCDLVLIHPEVSDGDPVGFVLSPDSANSGSSFSVQRELDSDGYVHVFIFFTILLADQLRLPNGSIDTSGRDSTYAQLMEFLEQEDGLSIETIIGTFMGVGPLGHSATEMHLVDASYISCKFTNLSIYHPPIDSDILFGSLWQADTPEEDAFTWETSVWR